MMRWPGIAIASCFAGALAGCAEKCDTYPNGQETCVYEPACHPDPPECASKAAPGDLFMDVSTPLPVRVEIYRGSDLETGTYLHSVAAVSKNVSVPLSSGDYVAAAIYVAGGDTTVVVDVATMTQEKLDLCSGKTCYGYRGARMDLRRK